MFRPSDRDNGLLMPRRAVDKWELALWPGEEEMDSNALEKRPTRPETNLMQKRSSEIHARAKCNTALGIYRRTIPPAHAVLPVQVLLPCLRGGDDVVIVCHIIICTLSSKGDLRTWLGTKVTDIFRNMFIGEEFYAMRHNTPHLPKRCQGVADTLSL